MTTDRETALAAAARLTGALDNVAGRLEQVNDASETRDKALSDYTHRTRHIVWALIVSLTLDLLLTVVITVVAFQAHDASSLAQEVHAGNLAACAAGNQYRATQIETWNHLVLVAPPPSHQTAAEQRRREEVIREFLAFIRRVNAPRNCRALYRLR